jgi:hypothetical protein
MTTKHLTLIFTPEDFSWLIRKAESLGKFPDQYVEELIDRERTADNLSGKEPRTVCTHDAGGAILAVDARDNTPQQAGGQS